MSDNHTYFLPSESDVQRLTGARAKIEGYLRRLRAHDPVRPRLQLMLLAIDAELQKGNRSQDHPPAIRIPELELLLCC